MTSESEIVKCGCGLAAALKTSSSGRKYYGCPKSTSYSIQCDFTRMLPPEPVVRENQLQAPPALNQPQEQAPPVVFPSLTQTPSKGTKRASSNVDQDMMLLTPSQKRTKIIDEALRSLGPENCELSTPNERRTKSLNSVLPRPHLPNSAGELPKSSSQSTSTAAGQPIEVDLSVDLTTAMQVQTRSPSAGPSRLPARSMFEGAQGPSGMENLEGGAWPPATPPHPESTSRRVIQAGLTSPSPSPLQAAKGKQKALDEIGDLTTRILDSGGSVASRVGRIGAARTFPSASVATTLHDLEGLPEYMRRQERLHDIKDLKIKHLENEVQRLKARQAELESILRVYESSDSDAVPPTSQDSLP